ncbi:hypothetical protein RFI_22758 [Reticulomyxa filosa]|uniref:Uncharacterized protein n=1 Tax=Reticulomyxa filosa TaxID=46433 RepID=X6MNC7_RETFI|nr:hypothetical protein RFI_22758 [Reticulomyxa filosa]|eukprot:ETO14610.1 hypothetical protein RFI_22758 [Reticulomyxa filosa]
MDDNIEKLVGEDQSEEHAHQEQQQQPETNEHEETKEQNQDQIDEQEDKHEEKDDHNNEQGQQVPQLNNTNKEDEDIERMKRELGDQDEQKIKEKAKKVVNSVLSGHSRKMIIRFKLLPR